MKRVTLLVGQPEPGEYIIAGGFDTNLLDIVDAEEVERIFAKAKREWAPDCTEWREVRIDLDDDGFEHAFGPLQAEAYWA